MDPTPAEHETVLAELLAREPIFHPPPTDRPAFDALVVPDFWEVGATGNVYDKDTIWAVVRRRVEADQPPLRTEDGQVRRLSQDTWLLTYRLWQGARPTRRATVWRADPTGWVAVYHQGTEIQALPAEVGDALADPAR